MSFQLKIINPEKDIRWDKFVFNHPNGSIYHHSAWLKVLESTFGYSPFYVALERTDTGQLEGILPFQFINSKLTGKRLVSLPFTSYCNCLVPESELENIIRFAYKHHLGVDYLELKFINYAELSVKKEADFITHTLNLDKDIEQILISFHYTSIRQRIKRAEKNNLKFRIANKEEDLQEFYKLHTKVRKKHGLPPHPYTFFLNMWQELRERNFLFVPVIEYKDKIIAASVVLRSKNTFHLEYSASDQNFHKLCSNQKLIWEAIKIAHNAGARYFDFGRSPLKNQSLIEFKERWGAKRLNLEYKYFPRSKRFDTEKGLSRKILSFTNHHLPDYLLRIEGKLLYPHLG
jgi:hypothetical protein